MKLLIKNMVCLRCKMVVKSELENLDLHYTVVELGEVQITEQLNVKKYKLLKDSLLRHGLELLDGEKGTLIEKIQNIVVEMVHYNEQPPTKKISDYLSEKLNYDYNYLSKLFSEVKGITIEKYIIAHKIERVKELLVYEELTLTEIAHKLHYSVAHLSSQFKKITGLTPSFFRELKHTRLNSLKNS